MYTYLGVHGTVPPPSSDNVPTSPKKIHHVSQSDNPTKITIKTTTLGVRDAAGESSSSSGGERTAGKPGRKPRKPREFVSPGADASIHVDADGDPPPAPPAPKRSSAQSGNSRQGGGAGGGGRGSPNNSQQGTSEQEKTSITVSFDLNTKKLWQDLHWPYGNYTNFFRHLILLEKYWRSGDLLLKDDASPKAKVYIKSVVNRIEGYEGQHKRSGYDLSEWTRPDMSVPPAPAMYQGLDVDEREARGGSKDKDTVATVNEDGGSDEIVVLDDDEPTPAKKAKVDQTDSSTILRIPNFPVPKTVQQPETSPNMPTKIRVRTDLMHLGLKPKGDIPTATATATSGGPKQQQQKQAQQQQIQPHILQQHLTRGSNEKTPAKKDSFKIADLVGTKAVSSTVNTMPKVSSQSNLLQLLNKPPGKNSAESSGPLLGNTSLIGASVGKKTATVTSSGNSNNSQLFKSGEQGSSAIPLTFNNSIAEVLAAASKAKQQMEAEAAAAAAAAAASNSKPEVTITAKPVAKPTPVRQQPQPQQLPASMTSPPTVSSPSFVSLMNEFASPKQQKQRMTASEQENQIMRAQKQWAEEELRRLMAKAAAASVAGVSSSPSLSSHVTRTTTAGLLTSPSPSGGVSSVQRPKSANSSSTLSNINSSTGVSNISQIHPLLDMNKLLHSTSPGIAPHIVAQTALPSAAGTPSSTPKSSSSSTQKIASKPPGPLPSAIRPVQLSKSTAQPQGIQTVNKKSLNTVLDRLSGLKTATAPIAASASHTSTSSMPKTTSSSLVQQLQAPPMSSLNKTASSSVTSSKGSSSSKTTPTSTASAAAALAAANSAAALASSINAAASLNPFGLAGYPATQMVGQPMVQYPTTAQAWAQQQQQQQQAVAAQQAAMLLAAAGGAAAGIPGMTAQQATAAMQELVKMSLQQQPKQSSSSPSATSTATSSSRLRAPPPLTHMGRQGGGGGGGSSGKAPGPAGAD